MNLDLQTPDGIGAINVRGMLALPGLALEAPVSGNGLPHTGREIPRGM